MKRTRSRKIRRSFDLPVFVLALASLLVAIEFVLQLMVMFFPSTETLFTEKLKAPQVQISTGEIVQSGGESAALPRDSYGFRNPSVPERSLAVAFGDDATYGAEIAWQDTWPARLAEILAEPVYSMALPGTSPADHFLQLTDALRQNSQWLILPVNLADDLVEASVKVYTDSSLTEFRNEDKDVSREVLRQESQTPLLMPFEENRPLAPSAKKPRKIARSKTGNLKTVQLLKKLAGRPAVVNRESDLQISRLDAGFWEDQDLRRIEKQAEARLRALDRRDVRVSEGLRLNLELLRKMQDRSLTEKKNLLVVLVPTRESVMASAFVRAGGEMGQTYQRLIEEENHIRGKIRAFLDSQNIATVDLFPALRKMAADGINPYGPNTDSSLNPVGHELYAERLTVWLKQARRRSDERDIRPERPAKPYDAARSAVTRGLAVLSVFALIYILWKTTPWQNSRAILLLVLYLGVQVLLLWRPIEFYPITTFQRYSRPVPRTLDYGRILVVLDQDGELRRLRVEEILPAYAGTRLHRIVRTVFSKPEAGRDLSAMLGRLCREKRLGDVREVRFEEWKWDYLSDPYDPDRGFLLRRVVVKSTGNGNYA